jgi:hypothetical protein
MLGSFLNISIPRSQGQFWTSTSQNLKHWILDAAKHQVGLVVLKTNISIQALKSDLIFVGQNLVKLGVVGVKAKQTFICHKKVVKLVLQMFQNIAN